MATTMTTIQRYNHLAGFFGWLPYCLNEHSSARTLREAAARCAGLYADLGAELAAIADAQQVIEEAL